MGGTLKTNPECLEQVDSAAPDLIALANEYAKCANALNGLRKQNRRLQSAPHRFAALHAIDLYLNACLIHLGKGLKHTKSLQHNFYVKFELLELEGFVLKQRFKTYLKLLTDSGEYTQTRYSFHTVSDELSIPQLQALLREIAKKAKDFVSKEKPRSAA